MEKSTSFFEYLPIINIFGRNSPPDYADGLFLVAFSKKRMGTYRPISSFTSPKQRMAKSRSSLLWPALI